MEDQNKNRQYPPVRRRKKIPKWKRMLRKYWPPIRFGLILVAFVCIITLGVVGIVNVVRLNDTSINNQTDPSDQYTTGPVQTTVAPTHAPSQVELMAQELIQEADFVAAGYDYEKAIQMLQAFPYLNDVPELAAKIEEYRTLDSQLVTYTEMDKVTHVFFHSLIVDPARAFDRDYTNAGYNQYMTTIDEFNKMMQQMYDNGFVLVTPYQVAQEVYTNGATRFEYCQIRLPAGKKPFIMSQDDLNYYGYMIGEGDGVDEIPAFADATGDGFASRIVIGEDGYPTCEYMDENGNITYGDYDLVPVLETFIQEHPDFAYKGARAVLGMTGYEGVFGYRTKPSYKAALGSSAYQQEIDNAKAVAQCLRDHGWILASHSYGHPAYGNINADRVEVDSDKWEDTVESVIGDVDIILYPNGSDIAGLENYTFDNRKFQVLYEDGYRYFFNVDSSIYWSQLGENYYRGGRRNLDGYRMYYHPHMLDDLFDTSTVFDPARPTPVPEI